MQMKRDLSQAPPIRGSAWLAIDTRAWLLAGIVAIAVNTVLLNLAARSGLQTGHGGLLQLIRPWLAPVLDHMGLTHAWTSTGLPVPGTPVFKMGFHVFVGMLMAAIYVCAERFVHWRPWLKGLVYAVVVYLANALIVLPLLGQGIAGSRVVSGYGLVYFAFAHTTFFLLLAWCYARWRRRRPVPS